MPDSIDSDFSIVDAFVDSADEDFNDDVVSETDTDAVEEVASEPDESGPAVAELDADALVRVTVDGKVVEMSVRDALAAQEKAAQLEAQVGWAEELRVALSNDPRGTVAAIAEQFGLTIAQAQEVVEQAVGDDDGLTPREREMIARQEALDARLRAFEEAELKREIDATISNLSAKYADWNTDRVIDFALKNGIADLELAYRASSVGSKDAEIAALKAQIAEIEANQQINSSKAGLKGINRGRGANPGIDDDDFDGTIMGAWEASGRR